MSSQHEDSEIARGRYLALRSAGGWEYVARANASAVVVILPITDDDRIVLVEQHRPPIGKNAVELPAGLVGDDVRFAKEDCAAAARRELLEETGYDAAEMTLLAEGPSSAGLTSEVVQLYHARGLRKVGEALGDGHEQITLHEVPLSQLRRWLAQQTAAGRAVDLKIYAGLQLIGKSC